MMKYIIFVLTLSLSISVGAQDEIPLKTDGTKYYIQIFDGVNNDKIIYHNSPHPDWQTKLQVADFFDGSDNQLWSFEATEMFPGYFSIVNHDPGITLVHHLMSWNWHAYFADNRDPLTDMEMQYKVREIQDGWYVLENFDKPAGLYGIDYTPGADAMNVKEDGYVAFRDVKSEDVTVDNMVNKAFRFVEFNPVALFNDAIARGQVLHDENEDLPEQARLTLFTTLEEARAIRVFGTEAEMLAYQPTLDEAIGTFTRYITLKTFIQDAKEYIDTLDVDSDIAASFNQLIDEAEDLLNSGSLTGEQIDALIAKIEGAQRLIAAILAAQEYSNTIPDVDTGLLDGNTTSINSAKAALADSESEVLDYDNAILHLLRTQEIIDELVNAFEVIANTEEFEEEKNTLSNIISQVISVINTEGSSVEDLDLALIQISDATAAFLRALEAGDTPVEISNGDFEEGLENWHVASPTPGSAYPEMKGVDGSQSITTWSGSDYQMRVFQAISNIPDGIYVVSCYANVNFDNVIGVFARSEMDSTLLPIQGTGGLSQFKIEVEVTNGLLEYGIRGVASGDMIPAGNWIVFDNFEVKFSANVAIANAGFEDDLLEWTTESDIEGRPYIENKGVDGSKSVTFWHNADYQIHLSQTLTGLSNGTYLVSVMTNSNVESSFILFGETSDTTYVQPIAMGGLTKHTVAVPVTDGTLKFGMQGVGENGLAPAGHWVVIDNFSISRQPDIPVYNHDFELDFEGWIKESTVDWMPYIENKGVDGSKSVTFWNSEDYYAFTYQTLAGLANGSYEISAMMNTPSDMNFQLFGATADEEFANILAPTAGLEKKTVEARVSDGMLDIGVSGAGEGDTAPAGQWVVFDNFEVKLKSITPVHEDPLFTPIVDQEDEESIEEDEESVTFRTERGAVIIHSQFPIVSYSLFSINGSLISQEKCNQNDLTLRVSSGIFVVQVRTNTGHHRTQQVLIF